MQEKKTDAQFDVAVVGLGYVGLSLAVQCAKKGLFVLGVDLDGNKIASLVSGKSYIDSVCSKELQELIGVNFFPQNHYQEIGIVKNIIVCVPTPLNLQREPDLKFVLNSASEIGKFLKAGSLVVLESTTYPGTTEGLFKDILENTSELKAGVDFNLAYSPEREDPGNEASKLSNIPKVVGGLTNACSERAAEFYSKIAKSIHLVRNCRTAEASKLLENIFRCVNIALVNELKVVYKAMDIDIWEVVNAAKTKPFGFMAFYPGPGMGGHCIPVDPFYLTWKAREFGVPTRFIELAGEINWEMPLYVLNQIFNALNSIAKSIKKSKILIIGLAYKPGIGDIRESPAIEIFSKLEKFGAEISYFDPFVPVFLAKSGKKYFTISKEECRLDFDLSVVCTNHPGTPFELLYLSSKTIVDTRNVFQADPDGKIFKS